MIKFGVREYILSHTPLIVNDRIVAYDENDKEISFDTDMSSHINEIVAVIKFSSLGELIVRYYARLKEISTYRDPWLDLDTWKITTDIMKNTIVYGGGAKLKP